MMTGKKQLICLISFQIPTDTGSRKFSMKHQTYIPGMKITLARAPQQELVGHSVVIFDEVHYVNDVERGVVLEEVIIMRLRNINVLISAAITMYSLTHMFVGGSFGLQEKEDYQCRDFCFSIGFGCDSDSWEI